MKYATTIVLSLAVGAIISAPSAHAQTPTTASLLAQIQYLKAQLAALEQRLAKTRALKQGMMQELLTGRTRLV